MKTTVGRTWVGNGGTALPPGFGPRSGRLAPRAQAALLLLPRHPQVLRRSGRERRPRGEELVDASHDPLVAERREHRLREVLDEVLVARRRESGKRREVPVDGQLRDLLLAELVVARHRLAEIGRRERLRAGSGLDA